MTAHSESTTLGVRQAKRPRAQVFSEDPILLPEIVDQIVLVTVHPASEREDEELQRRRHSLRLLGRLDQHRPSLGRFFAPYGTAPTLDAATLAAYQPAKVVAMGGHTIDDHPYLAQGSEMYGDVVRSLFNAFRKEVLALDPCVSEEFMKYYVAYKAETNFVDVVPQAKRLRLSSNMAFAEINDPKGLCRDITNIGRWGNGDVEVGLKSLDELPYVMGLVPQSYEHQMGDGGQA